MSRVLAVILIGGMAWGQSRPQSTPQVPPPAPASQNRSTRPPAPGPEPADVQPAEPDEAGFTDAADLLPEPPSLPQGKATLVGGTLTKLDRVRDQITVRPFGGRDVRILFDGRTQIYRDGTKIPLTELRGGEKIYVDTILDGSTIFAKNIRLLTRPSPGESRGQIVRFDRDTNELVVNDVLSPKPVRLHIGPDTKITREQQPASVADLHLRSLIEVKFGTDSEGQAVAREISIVAQPGADFTFAGRVTNLDLHAGLLVVEDPRDRKIYEVHFDPAAVSINGDLVEGAEVAVTADFDGTRYTTNAIVVNTRPAE